jgi:hypothetical protein
MECPGVTHPCIHTGHAHQYAELLLYRAMFLFFKQASDNLTELFNFFILVSHAFSSCLMLLTGLIAQPWTETLVVLFVLIFIQGSDSLTSEVKWPQHSCVRVYEPVPINLSDIVHVHPPVEA